MPTQDDVIAKAKSAAQRLGTIRKVAKDTAAQLQSSANQAEVPIKAGGTDGIKQDKTS